MTQGRYLCRLTVTGRGDTVGVYCNIDGNTYKLFTVDLPVKHPQTIIEP